MDTNEPVLYEVWGWDTFSSESYFCGRYDTLEEAEAEMAKEKEETWRFQSEGLRDSFSINAITPSEIAARERRMEERRAYEEADRAYSMPRLEENLEKLSRKLISALRKRKQKAAPDSVPRSFKRNVHIDLSTPGDCITYLSLGVRWSKTYGHCFLRYALKINCQTTRSCGWECEMGTPYTSICEFEQWLSSALAPAEVAKQIADSLQKEFWRS